MIRDFNSVQLWKNIFDPFDLNELLQELPRKQKEVLWERLTQLMTESLVENPVETWQRVEDNENNDDMEVEIVPEMKQTVAVIQGVTAVVTASIPAVDETVNCKALLECVFILNGVLPALPESEKVLKGAIQRVCEMWWEKGLEGKEQLGKTLFIVLLKKSLNKGADVVRMWDQHQILLCFDYDSEESDEVKDLLLQCFISVKHIKKEEGRRFLSFLFSWNVNFIKMIHGTVKNQLQFFPRSLMEYISEVYFRAWKKVSGEFIEILEHNCIQDFMHHGIHLPRSSSVHSKVREMLSYFHKQSKVRQGVEEMLYRLYQPILWRALKARNSEVRSNAAFLFVDAFPVRDPRFNTEEMDNEIQKQFDELFSLLEDPHPVVRSTGILGVTQITSKYWEMIPPTLLADLLKKLIGELTCDITSADVRCSVFKCLPIILDNKLSHPFLEQLLPASIKTSERRVRIHVTHESKPELAIDYIEYLLTHPVNRTCLLSVPKKKLKKLLKILSAVLGSILKATDAGSGSCNQAIGLRAFSLFCRLSIHLQNKFSEEGKDYLSLLKEAGAWIESQVVPFILASDQEDDISKHNIVSELIIQAYLAVCKDVIMVSLGNLTFQAHLLDIALSVIQTERGGFCAPLLLYALKEIIEASLTQNTETDEVANLFHAVQTVFQKVLECVACRLKKKREEGIQLIHSIQMPLGEFIHAVQCWHSSCPAVHQGVLSTLLGAIVAEIICVLQKVKLMLTFFFFFFLLHLLLFKHYVGTTELCSESVIFVLRVKISCLLAWNKQAILFALISYYGASLRFTHTAM
uniref:Non-SMC condensin II complex subunit G2 n=1 Tax=Aquila chrysaetos chrysaetos TaxID=223781 RepID=A0A663DV92_AQUCH